jgi:homoserine kinase type II
MTNVYVLWHYRTDERGCDHDKMLGIYTTRAKAEEGLALLRDKPGFRDYPDGFEILEGELDTTGLLEGFITVEPGEY